MDSLAGNSIQEQDMRTIGTLAQVTIDVEDLEVGAQFWSTLTGLPALPSPAAQEWKQLSPAAVTAGGPTIALRQSTSPKGSAPNRGHLDITVTDVDVALAQVESIGGRRKTEPSLYPRPHSQIDGLIQLDWVVAVDPFGNEFCILRDVEDVERQALAVAALDGPASDGHWRAIARAARTQDADPSTVRAPRALPGEGIGEVRCCVINVDDLAVALQFWSALIGVGPISSEWPFRFAYLGDEDERTSTWRHQLILQKSQAANGHEHDRVHYDIHVQDLDSALAQLLWLGASVVRRPGHRDALSQPHPGDLGGHVVMSDRAGNQFCIVRAG
jgi:predicted enzyme related to lactoylglutathione lyase